MNSSNSSPIPEDRRKTDCDHLKLLAVFHFIGAGLGLLGILFIGGHYFLFNAFFAHPEMWEPQNQPRPPAEFFALFKWFYLAFAIWFSGSTLLNLLSGIFLLKRINRTFSLVIAGVNCLHIPLGTVLGVFTIIVLLRDSVRELYAA